MHFARRPHCHTARAAGLEQRRQLGKQDVGPLPQRCGVAALAVGGQFGDDDTYGGRSAVSRHRRLAPTASAPFAA
jgi:hypothetical protein